MLVRCVATLALALLFSSPALAQGDGVVRVRSAYSMAETIARIKADVTAKGIMHFAEIDQAALAARPEAGLDWPVRLLVNQDEAGQVWAVYTDFKWIAARHGITDRDREFATATGVIASITSTIRE
jgi:uncharacterized protein (DUF302 family)